MKFLRKIIIVYWISYLKLDKLHNTLEVLSVCKYLRYNYRNNLMSSRKFNIEFKI